MSTIYCKYHPKAPARWECTACELSICGECSTKDIRRNEAQCPVCKKPLEPMSASNYIEPFWQRIPKFFKYPANGQSLIFISVIGFFLSFGMYGGLMSYAMTIFMSLAFLKYAIAVLEHTADGRSSPPDVSVNMITSGHFAPLKMLATYAAFGFMVSLLGNYGGAPAAIAGALFLLACLPASTMIIATSDSFVHAINPITLVDYIRRIGKGYWLLYLFLVLLSACQTAVTSIIAAADTFLLWPLQSMAGLYFTLIMFNMMGYVIFQYHEELDYSVRLEVDQDYGEGSGKKKTAAKITNPTLQEAELLIKEGNIVEAIARLDAAILRANVPLEVHDFYHNLLHSSDQTEKMIKHAEEYINILLYNKKYAEAVKVVVNCYKHKAIPRPRDPDNMYALALILKEKRAFKECVAVINNFHNLHPGHQDIPKLYLMCAQVLSEELHQDGMAQKILQFLKAKYPQHDLTGEIDRYYGIVSSVANG